MTERAEVKAVCDHHPDMVTVSESYKHCSDCGAVASRPLGSVRPGVWLPWHTCEMCVLPGPYKSEVKA